MEPNVTRRRLLGTEAVTDLPGLASGSGATPYVGRQSENEHTLADRNATSPTITAKVGMSWIVGKESFLRGRSTMNLACNITQSTVVERIESRVGAVTAEPIASDFSVISDVCAIHVQDIRGPVSTVSSTSDIVELHERSLAGDDIHSTKEVFV